MVPVEQAQSLVVERGMESHRSRYGRVSVYTSTKLTEFWGEQ